MPMPPHVRKCFAERELWNQLRAQTNSPGQPETRVANVFQHDKTNWDSISTKSTKNKKTNIYSGFFRPVFEHDQLKRKLGSLFAYHHADHAQKLSDGAWTNSFKLLSSLSCRGSVPAPNPSNEFWKQYLFLKVTAWPRHPDGRWNVPNHLCMLVICGQFWIGYSFGRRVCQPRAPEKVKPPKCQVPCEPKKIGPKESTAKTTYHLEDSGSIYGIGFLAFYLTFFLAYLVILSIYCDILSDIVSDILSGIFSGIHSGPLYLTYILMFSLASLMAFYLAFFLTGVLTSFLACVRVRLCCRGACDRSQVCARRARHELLERSCSTWAGTCWRSGSIGAEARERKRGEMTE